MLNIKKGKNMNSPRFTATHIAKPREPTLKPKLVGSVCMSQRTAVRNEVAN